MMTMKIFITPSKQKYLKMMAI